MMPKDDELLAEERLCLADLDGRLLVGCLEVMLRQWRLDGGAPLQPRQALQEHGGCHSGFLLPVLLPARPKRRFRSGARSDTVLSGIVLLMILTSRPARGFRATSYGLFYHYSSGEGIVRILQVITTSKIAGAERSTTS